MTSQTVDIFSMLNKAQTEYKHQQHNQSVAAFFQQASNGAPNTRSMPIPVKSLSSLEQIERQIRSSPPSSHDPHLNPHNTHQSSNVEANSPLAQFFNANNFSNVAPRPIVTKEAKDSKNKQNEQATKVSVPPGFRNKPQPQKNLLSASKETKLITPTMFAQSNGNEKKSPEPLTKNQLTQALSYLIQNDEEFMKKVHEAYIKSINIAS